MWDHTPLFYRVYLHTIHPVYLGFTSHIKMPLAQQGLQIYRGDDKSLALPGRKQANVSVRMAWISFGVLPCRGEKKNLTACISLLLKSHASLTRLSICSIWRSWLRSKMYKQPTHALQYLWCILFTMFSPRYFTLKITTITAETCCEYSVNKAHREEWSAFVSCLISTYYVYVCVCVCVCVWRGL